MAANFLPAITRPGRSRKSRPTRWGPDIFFLIVGASWISAAQDTKAIALNGSGRMVKFEMNDRCAAGTGKFLEFMSVGLGMSVGEFGPFALRGRPGIQLTSMCTVFAESEVTSLIAQGKKAEDIALALHRSVVKRSVAMLSRVGPQSPVVFAGGVARNPCMVKLITDALGGEVHVPEKPEMVGALGAALFAARRRN